MKSIIQYLFHKEKYGKVKLDDPANIEARKNLFRHEALVNDPNSPSIRLVKVLPPPHLESHLRCRMRLSSTEDDYTCLLYVRGEPAPGEWIAVNRKWFFVRDNLREFLLQASQLPQIRSRWLWIDALCIDQSNVLERQHQVQQMDQIFSAAKEVISWFGMDPGIAKFLEPSQNEGLDILCRAAFETSPYWRRAWITQEFVLGREIKLLAGSTLTSLEPTTNHPAWTLQQRVGYPMSEIFKTRNVFWRTRAFGLPSSTLFQLLDTHGNKLCHIRRDSIFSLLGLCRYGNKIRVNYGVSDAEMAISVLQSHSESFCLCLLSLLGHILGLKSEYHMALGGKSEVFGLQTYGVIRLRLQSGQVHIFSQIGLQNAGLDEKRETKSSSERDVCFGSISIGGATGSQLGDSLAFNIVVDLATVCPMYVGTVTIEVDAESFQYSICQPSDLEDRASPKSQPRQPVNESIRLKMSNGRNECLCALSMGFWFHLVNEAFPTSPGPEKCCSRKYEDRHYVSTKMALTFPSIQFTTAIEILERQFMNPFDTAGLRS